MMMWDVTYHAENASRQRMLERELVMRRHLVAAREANPSRVSVLGNSVSAGAGRFLERGSNFVGALFKPVQEPSEQCC